jgi:hypothetical protein
MEGQLLTMILKKIKTTKESNAVLGVEDNIKLINMLETKKYIMCSCLPAEVINKAISDSLK